jgi:protein-disulfide isomerase
MGVETHHDTAGRWKTFLETVATLLMIVVASALLWRMFTVDSRPRAAGATRPAARAAPAPLPREPLSLEGAAIKGSKDAKVAIIEYSDFQCPYCATFARDTFPELDKRYVETGKVVFAFRHLPLETIHPRAVKAAESAECAGRKGRFWEMHDRLFLNPKELGDVSLRSRATAIGLDLKDFDDCLDGQTAAKVRSDASGAKALAVSGTPTFFVGSVQSDGRVKVLERFSGAQTVASFEKILDALLQAGQPRNGG